MELDMVVQKCTKIAAEMRKDIVSLADLCGGDIHWGGDFSCVEVLSVLYGHVLRGDNSTPFEARDKFILSKGHSAAALYTAMVETGRLSREELKDYQQNGKSLTALSIMNQELGIECSGGSLGLGLSVGVGMALLAKRKKYDYKTYVLTGDGECNEGSIWEAVMSASQYGLETLTLLIDHNGLQSDGRNQEIMSLGNLAQRLEAFGWECVTVDGHNIEQIINALGKVPPCGKPYAIVLDTIKGKGISFMEDEFSWHHRILEKEQLETAKREVGLV